MPIIYGLDIETETAPNHFPWKDGFYMTCLSISKPSGIKLTWFFDHADEDDNSNWNQKFDEIQSTLDEAEIVAAHNLKFDLNCVRTRLKFKKLFCTMVAEYLLNYHSNKGLKLADMAPKYGLSNKLDKVKKMWDAGYATRDIPKSILKEYCEDDAEKARLIAEKQYWLLKAKGWSKVFELQMEWLDILSEMECNGIVWDNNHAQRILAKYTRYREILDRRILHYIAPFHTEVADINLSSNDELSAVLYGGVVLRRLKRPKIIKKNVKVQMPYVFTYKDGTKRIKNRWNSHPDTRCIRMVYRDVPFTIRGIGLKPAPKSETKKSTKDRPYYATDKDTLAKIKPENDVQKRVCALLQKRSKIHKVVTTFFNAEKGTGLISKVAADGKLHTNYNQTVTATGRLSSSDPNSQNLPRGNTSPIKQCILPSLDGIMNADISQIELRVPAQLSQDPVMMKEFITGEDLHDNCRKDTMGLPPSKENRVHAKVFNFRMIYGGTEWGYFKDPDMPDWSLKRWKEVIQKYYEKYKGLEAWQQGNIKHVIDHDGTLQLFTGRIFRFTTNAWKKYDERQIKNYPVQGTAGGDLLPLAACIIRKGMRKRGLQSRMILTVHDSLVFDYIEHEKYELARLCIDTFNNLPKYITQYWGYKWEVPITGEVEIGPNYGKLKEYM